jgi:ornithine--oxo-acid transaminase
MLTPPAAAAKLKGEAIRMSAAAIGLTEVVLPLKVTLPQDGPAFLMCAPRLYDVDYVINPWMAGNVHAASRERAMQQWQELYEAVSQVADIQLIEPQPGSPDMVFTANAGLLRGDEVAISSFFHPERQGEEPHFREWFRGKGYKILELPRETPFEGEGDALFSEDGSRLWAGFGPRTQASSHQALRDAWSIEVVGLELVDPRFYHLDTCFAPLSDGFVMYFPEAFSAASVREIEAFYPAGKRIIVEEADAARFACNAVNVGETIIVNRISGSLAKRLESLGFEVVQVELSEFLRAGGAAKCLVMKLRSDALN